MIKNYVKLIVAFVFATNLMAQNVPNYVPKNGLVGWWPFNGNANDESGNGNHGTVNGATLTADRFGKLNSAYNFDGISNYIESKINYGSDFSISFWLNSGPFKNYNNQIGAPVISTLNNIDGWPNNWEFQFAKLNSEFGIGNGKDGYYAIKDLFENKWYYITCSYNSSKSEMSIYNNSIFISKYYFEFRNTNKKTIFGGRANSPVNFFYEGKLDDISIYNRALTQEEITALYTSTPLCTTPSAVITPQGNTTFCQGGFVNLNASTGANYTYEWYNNGQLINGANSSVYQAKASGNYTVKVIDGVCNSTSAATMVTVNPLPNVTLNALNQFTLKNASPIQLVASPTGGTFTGEGVQSSTFTPANVSLGKKTITYNYTSPQGCSGKASSYTIIADTLGNICSTYDTLKVKFKLTTGIKANQYTTMNVYPNPTSDVIIIEASDVASLNGYSYKLVDIQGKEVYNALVTLAKTEVSLKSFGKAGVYILHVVDANNISIQTKQIVLQ